MTEILLLLTAYFLGSIPTSYLVVQIFHGRDIRQVGTTNPGMMNVWDNIGLWSALLVGIGDIGKGSLAIGLGIWLGADPYLLGAVLSRLSLDMIFQYFLDSMVEMAPHPPWALLWPSFRSPRCMCC